MRKLILAATTIAALAVPTIAPALASASVDRYQTQTATFTVTSRRDHGRPVRATSGRTTSRSRSTRATARSPAPAPTYDQRPRHRPLWTENVTGSFGNGTVSFATEPHGARRSR